MSTRRRGRHVNTALTHWETGERKNNDTDNKTENRQTDIERNKGGIKGSPKGKMLTFYILYLFSDHSCLKTIASMFIHIIIIYFFVRRFLKEYFFVNAYKNAFIRLYFVKKTCFNVSFSMLFLSITFPVHMRKFPQVRCIRKLIYDRSFGKAHSFPWPLFTLTLIIIQNWYACTYSNTCIQLVLY